MKKLRVLNGAASVCAALNAFGAVTDRLETGFQSPPAFPPRVQAGVDRDVMLDDMPHRQHNVGMSGHLALQIHRGDRLKLRFKDIKLREPEDADRSECRNLK